MGWRVHGLRARDEMVLRIVRDNGVLIVITTDGRFDAEIADTVEIHCNTLRMVKRIFNV